VESNVPVKICKQRQNYTSVSIEVTVPLQKNSTQLIHNVGVDNPPKKITYLWMSGIQRARDCMSRLHVIQKSLKMTYTAFVIGKKI
jgi:hypothetical protein